jgi:hypothetical protein
MKCIKCFKTDKDCFGEKQTLWANGFKYEGFACLEHRLLLGDFLNGLADFDKRKNRGNL